MSWADVAEVLLYIVALACLCSVLLVAVSWYGRYRRGTTWFVPDRDIRFIQKRPPLPPADGVPQNIPADSYAGLSFDLRGKPWSSVYSAHGTFDTRRMADDDED